MDELRVTIYKVADEIRGRRTITLRQLYYALTVRAVLEKTEADYKRLAHITAAMRRDGIMPYDWIEDGTAHNLRAEHLGQRKARTRKPREPVFRIAVARRRSRAGDLVGEGRA